MTVTLRYDIGVQIGSVLSDRYPSLFTLFSPTSASRWAGVSRDRTLVCTFAVKLPKQIAQCYTLILALNQTYHDSTLSWTVRNSAKKIEDKLRLSTGASLNWDGHEAPFRDAINKEPGELSHWTAYADYLQENGDKDQIIQGKVIAGWLGKSPVKTKYGIPVIARKDYRP